MKRTYPAFALLNAAGRMVDVSTSEDTLLIGIEGGADTVVRCRVILEQDRARRPVSKKAPALIPKSVREEVMDRDAHRCRWCGAAGFLELHHIRKRSQGRDDRPGNLITLCKSCHARTDWPYSKGRLMVMVSLDGGFSLFMATKPDKFAPDPVTP